MIFVIILNITLVYLVNEGIKYVNYIDRLESLPQRDNRGRFTTEDVRYEQSEPIKRLIKVKYYDQVYFI